MINASFFDRSALVVAKDLIGKYLVRKIDGKIYRYRIVETERYEGLEDRASHSSRGETPRNAPMFGAPGTIYVYFTYGMHYMLNIVCAKKGQPGAVLIRGAIAPDNSKILGPAKLTKALKINKDQNAKLLGKATGLWIEDHNGCEVGEEKIIATPRIGIGSAGEKWAKKKYRFIIKKYEYKKFK